MKRKLLVAPLTTRIEVRLIGSCGFLLCDEKQWNDKYNSSLSRYYMPFFWRRRKRFSFAWDRDNVYKWLKNLLFNTWNGKK